MFLCVFTKRMLSCITYYYLFHMCGYVKDVVIFIYMKYCRCAHSIAISQSKLLPINTYLEKLKYHARYRYDTWYYTKNRLKQGLKLFAHL